MTNRHGKKVAFLFGTLSGVMVTYFLMSEEGQKWKIETTKRVRQFSQRLSGQAQDQLDYISHSMDIFIDQLTTIEEDKILEEGKKNPSVAPQLESTFKRGMKSGVKYFQTPNTEK